MRSRRALVAVGALLVSGLLGLLLVGDDAQRERPTLTKRRSAVAVEPKPEPPPPPLQAPAPAPPPEKPEPEPPEPPEVDVVAVDRLPDRLKDLISKTKDKEELEQLRRHLERFWAPQARNEKADDWVARRLRDVRQQSGEVKIEALPAPDAAAAEQRRIEQLEKLRQRDAVGLLDHIHAGLAWLALHQAPDGHLSTKGVAKRCKELGHPPCARGGSRYPVSTTALATMAFLDFRDQDRHGLFEPYLARSVHWLLKQQNRDGSFRGGRSQYTSAIALMALGQAAAATQLREAHEAVRNGLFRFRSIAGPAGGFRYGVQQPGDLSVSGWVAQAVEMARLAKVEVPSELPQGLDLFLRECWSGGHHFSYQARGRERASLVPVGMLMGHILWDPMPPDVVETWRKWLRTDQRRRPGLYPVYYGVRVAIALEKGLPDPWRKWVFEIAAQQTQKGPAAGAFQKRLGPWFFRGGMPLQSAAAVLTLEHALYLR